MCFLPSLKEARLWIILFLIGAVFVSFSDFKSKSNDSKFYNRLVVQLSEKPVSQWVAPKWGDNFYGKPADKFIEDHPSGHIVVGVIFHKIFRVPAHHSLHIVQMLAQILSLFLLVAIVRFFIDDKKFDNILWVLLIIPIAFTYGIRGNHEQSLLFLTLLVIYSSLHVHKKKSYFLLLCFSTLSVLLVKGLPVVLMFPIAFVTYLLATTPIITKSKLLKAFSGLLVIFLVTFLSGYLYEVWYYNVTGADFFSNYWRTQIVERSFQVHFYNPETHLPWPLQKLKNLSYYFSRTIHYSAPWSIIAIVSVFLNRKKVKSIILTSSEVRLYLVLTLSLLAFIGAFSVSNRLASRYVFPSFYLMGALSVSFLLVHSVKFNGFAAKCSKLGAKNLAAVLWFTALNLHLLVYYLKK